MRRASRRALAAFAALLVGAAVWASAGNLSERPKLGLFSTLPIYWGEADSMEAMLTATAAPNWVRSALEQDYRLVPLNALQATGADEGALDKFDLLVMAQPRALSAEENVALDTWVRAGGRVLIFADPMLTQHSRFSIGDRRRAQDVVLLTPILRRWGMELQMDDSQQAGEGNASFDEVDLPVNLPGRLVSRPTAADAPSTCSLLSGGLIADCSIGQGRALVMADAAVLEDAEGGAGPLRAKALETLANKAFESR